ncbi:MAG TPA: hypothetical protein VN421_03265 [Pseudoflavonifractor sp.]|nr:hypothetical protein [Pseudoflavonifractor sp.]
MDRIRAARHDSRRWLKRRKPRRSDPLNWLPDRAVWERDVGLTVSGYLRISREAAQRSAASAYRAGRTAPGAEWVLTRSPDKLAARVEAVEWALRYLARADPVARRLAQLVELGQVKTMAEGAQELNISTASAKTKLALWHRAVAYGLGYRGGGPDG